MRMQLPCYACSISLANICIAEYANLSKLSLLLYDNGFYWNFMLREGIAGAFARMKTPFYYYDLDLLRATVSDYMKYMDRYGYRAHYALKANSDPRIVSIIREAGFGADCVSGNEVRFALESGFAPEKVVFAGVGKSDEEIRFALKSDILYFNCESIQEIEVIDSIAGGMKKKARVSVRINPDVDAHTHSFISTGRDEDKFGIGKWAFDNVADVLGVCTNIDFKGLHFHIGSQIADMGVFKELCLKANEICAYFESKGLDVANVSLGGGLGVDYEDPETGSMPDFEAYFKVVRENLDVRRPDGSPAMVHFEPGRSIVAQCGYLISRVLFIKNGLNKDFVILDAGMTDLLRPAFYGAAHKIENLTSESGKNVYYDVVGPVCESSDRFSPKCLLPETKRGDIFAICSAGAYGRAMSMRYNLRDIPASYYSDDMK